MSTVVTNFSFVFPEEVQKYTDYGDRVTYSSIYEYIERDNVFNMDDFEGRYL